MSKQCALCLEQKPLCNSHILPEFFYEPMYDDKHRLLTLSASGKKREKARQNGHKEKLLCATCESMFSEWERYISHIWHGRTPFTTQRDGDVLYLKDIDYKKLKLFQLSVLWRAGVCTLPFFNHVQLGPHSERLRAMLYSGNPGGQNDYPCVMVLLHLQRKEIAHMVVDPTRCKPLTHGWSYRFVFGGFLWVFSMAGLPSRSRSMAISESGDLTIFVKEATDLDFITDLMVRLIKRQNDSKHKSKNE